MSQTIRVAITDDIEMHRGMLELALGNYNRAQSDYQCEVVGTFEHGQDMLEGISSVQADMVTLDIRMPTMDGLTGLLWLRRSLGLHMPVIMVSSEEESNIDRFFQGKVSDKVKNMPFEQKLGHMAKVEERVLSGVQEEGKINELLPGCEKLCLDPIRYAQHLGANGFLHKPYTPDQTLEVVTRVLQGGAFTATK